MHSNPVLETDLRSSIPNTSLASISPPLFLLLQVFFLACLFDIILDLIIDLKWLQEKIQKKNVEQTEKVVPFITVEVAFGQQVS